MPLIAYLIAIIVAVGGVAIELELLINSPPAHPVAQTAAVHAAAPGRSARKVQAAPVSQPPAESSTAALSPIYPANPGGDSAQAPATETPSSGMTGVAHAATAPATAGASAPAPASERAAAEPAGATKDEQAAGDSNLCDIRACAAAYSSFRASDCTYQPFGGPRRVCSKGGGQLTDASAAPDTTAAREERRSLDARAEASCNVSRCSSMYSSFRASDCTFQPLGGGPRRLCER